MMVTLEGSAVHGHQQKKPGFCSLASFGSAPDPHLAILMHYEEDSSGLGWLSPSAPLRQAMKSKIHFENSPPSCKLTWACFSKTHSQSVDHYLFTKAFRQKVL